MPRIRGFFEYDNDDLTPGKKKEGGLHQNLYDGDGKLRGNARFIPDEKRADKPDQAKKESRRTRSAERSEKASRRARRRDEQRTKPDPEVIHETVYMYETIYVHDQRYDEEHERWLALEREENERLQARQREEQAKLIAELVKLFIAAATPHAKRLWHEKARPVVDARRAKKSARKPGKAAATEPIVVDGTVVDTTVVDSGGELAVAERVYRTNMSSAEAQARYLAALAARAFSDEQMRFVFNASIVDGDGLAELQHTLAELPPQQVKGIIKAVEANPAALSGDLLAELGKLLGLDRTQPEVVPLRSERANDGH